ncbi:MAG: response regulator transcription factor [Saprospiraceae bacterium]|nr:response regulator transcription factor [Candidatus Vicinibacter affinis]
MIKVLIVDDDPKDSDRLVKLLNQVDIKCEVLALCRTVSEAVEGITIFQPELVFLDVELEFGHTGFQVLSETKHINFDVIFTTHHIDRNIQAIRICSLTYIPKPIILDELVDALNKYLNKNIGNIGVSQTNSLKDNLHQSQIGEHTIWIPNGTNYSKIEIKNIYYCESDNQFTTFYVDCGQKEPKKIISSKGIGEWERDLEPFGICRIHKETLVNIKYVSNYLKGEGGTVVLTIGKNLNVSKSGKPKFIKMSGFK